MVDLVVQLKTTTSFQLFRYMTNEKLDLKNKLRKSISGIIVGNLGSCNYSLHNVKNKDMLQVKPVFIDKLTLHHFNTN